MPRVTLFFGAGASREFDYPTTSEFYRNLSNAVSEDVKRFLDLIGAAPEVKDIEHVLQFVDSITALDENPYVRAVFKVIPPTIPLRSGVSLNWNDLIALCSRLKDAIIDELHEQYEFDQGKLQKIVDTYHPLFEEISRISKSQCLDLFTTNYDSVIEEYCVEGKKEVQFTCGFERQTRSGREFWLPRLLPEWKGELGKGLAIKLYKLHGSLDWRETDDGRIERVKTEERVSSPTRRHKRNILIYPAQKNYLTEEPFKLLVRDFEDVLNQSSSCLVIGFSLRDPSINEILLGFLKREAKLIVVSPTASIDAEGNLLRDNKELTKRIICIDKPFGDPETLGLIVKSLEGAEHKS